MQPTHTLKEVPESTWWICLAEVEITFSEKNSPVLSPLLQRYKWLSVRLCTTEKIFRSLKGYTDMFYNRSSFSLVALLLLFSPSSICLPFSAAFDFFFTSAAAVSSDFPLHFSSATFVPLPHKVRNNTAMSDTDPEAPTSVSMLLSKALNL